MSIAFGDSRTFTKGNFSFSVSAFFPQNFTPRDAHCFWQWASRFFQLLPFFFPENFTPRDAHWPPMTFHWPSFDLLWPPIELPWPSMTFHFLVFFLFSFFPEISLLEMLIAFGNEHLKNYVRASGTIITYLSWEQGMPPLMVGRSFMQGIHNDFLSQVKAFNFFFSFWYSVCCASTYIIYAST